MGWWGYGVVDGDTPMDMVGTIEEAFDISNSFDVEDEGQDQEQQFVHNRNLFKAGEFTEALMADITEQASYEGEYLVYNVIGYLHLKYQVDMSEDVKAKVLASINEALEYADNWRDEALRRAELERFRKCVEAQDGAGLIISGLFWEGEFTKRTYFD